MGKLQKDFRFEIDTLGRMCVRARNEALASDCVCSCARARHTQRQYFDYSKLIKGSLGRTQSVTMYGGHVSVHISHLFHLALWRFYRCAVSLFFTVLSVGRSVLLQYIDTQQRIWRVTAVGRKPVRSPKSR